MKFFFFLLALAFSAHAKPVSSEFENQEDMEAFIEKMVQNDGFSRNELKSLFRKVRHLDAVIQLIKPSPRPKNWNAYRARFVEEKRIHAGVKFWQEHENALMRAEELYAVPPEIIVAIIGVETIYGKNKGKFRVLDALSTLAFDYPDTPNRPERKAFFLGELENTLLFARESHIDPLSLQGSYAGAIGLPQFMPGSIRKYAVDFDGDGKINLSASADDAIGSVGKFLSFYGYRRGPLVFPAKVASGGNPEPFLGEAKYEVGQLQAAGIVPESEIPPGIKLGLVDLENASEPTQYFLGAENFFSIVQYNRSYYYAMAVVDLSREIKAAHEKN